MNLARALHEIAACGATDTTNDTPARPALVRDDVYLPSDVAARLLPPDGYHDGERVVWSARVPGAGRRPRAH
jgi:hypothetical protein